MRETDDRRTDRATVKCVAIGGIACAARRDSAFSAFSAGMASCSFVCSVRDDGEARDAVNRLRVCVVGAVNLSQAAMFVVCDHAPLPPCRRVARGPRTSPSDPRPPVEMTVRSRQAASPGPYSIRPRPTSGSQPRNLSQPTPVTARALVHVTAAVPTVVCWWVELDPDVQSSPRGRSVHARRTGYSCKGITHRPHTATAAGGATATLVEHLIDICVIAFRRR